MYKKVSELYENLKDSLKDKKQAIIKNNIPKMQEMDENMLAIAEEIKKLDLKNYQNNFSAEEKENLKKLAQEIKDLQENNEMLINHSINVINNTLSGILNIIQNDKNSYNSKGKNCTNDDDISMSSIIEEA